MHIGENPNKINCGHNFLVSGGGDCSCEKVKSDSWNRNEIKTALGYFWGILYYSHIIYVCLQNQGRLGMWVRSFKRKVLCWFVSEHCSSFCDFGSLLTCWETYSHFLVTNVWNLMSSCPEFDEQMSRFDKQIYRFDEQMSQKVMSRCPLSKCYPTQFFLLWTFLGPLVYHPYPGSGIF